MCTGPFQPGEASKSMDPLAGVQCCQAKCTVKWVGRNCQRHMCRKHCRAAGGCSSNGHSRDGQPSSESFCPTSPGDLLACTATPLFCPTSPSQSHVLSAASCSQLDPPLSLSHGSDIHWPSDQSHLHSPPPMSQIDPLLRPPLSDAPDVSPLLADLLACPNSSALHIDPLLHSAGSLWSTSSESSFSSRASPPVPVSSSSFSISLPKSHGDKEQQSQLPSSRLTVADASINPRYTSQLRPIFVEHVAEVHAEAQV